MCLYWRVLLAFAVGVLVISRVVSRKGNIAIGKLVDGMTKTVYLGAEQISNASQRVAEATVEEKSSINEVEKGINNIL